MARITIEDCLKKIPNRFELTLAAANRARLLSTGAQPLIDPNRDKPTVIALREIAASKIGREMLDKQIGNRIMLSEENLFMPAASGDQATDAVPEEDSEAHHQAVPVFTFAPVSEPTSLTVEDLPFLTTTEGILPPKDEKQS